MFLALSFALACVCGAFLWGHRDSVFRLGANSLGPGPGEWLVEAPRVHGLSSVKLSDASQRHSRELEQRDCFVVVKDGVIVHETYREGGDLETLHHIDGVGRVAAALLVGAAARHGLIDLDTPLVDYGIGAPAVREWASAGTTDSGDTATVDPEALKRHPELRWGNEWAFVTARHVLSETTGVGEARAGTVWHHDNFGELLDVLSDVVATATGGKPNEWAKKHFTRPLGVSDFFGGNGGDRVGGTRLRFAGGQMATCRDAARFGQLIANGGVWLDENGVGQRLVDEDFVKRMTASSSPNANANAGYSTLVHPGTTASGQPRATAFFAGVEVGSGALGKGSRKAAQAGGRKKSKKEMKAGEKSKDPRQTKIDAAVSAEQTHLLGAAKQLDLEHAKEGHPTSLSSLGDAPQEKHRAPAWEDYEGAEKTGCGDTGSSSSAILGADGPSFPLAFAVGKLGKFVVVAPTTNTVVVSMGNTWGASAECPSGLRELLDSQTRIASGARRASAGGSANLGAAPGSVTAGYDETVLMRQLWSAVGEAVTPVGYLSDFTVTARKAVSGIGVKRLVANTDVDGKSEHGLLVPQTNPGAYGKSKASAIAAVAATDRLSETKQSQLEKASHVPDDYESQAVEEGTVTDTSALAASSRQDALASARRAQAERLAGATGGSEAARVRRRGVDETGKLGSDIDADPSGGRTGSCRCSCLPSQDGVGQCVNMRGVPRASCADVALLGGAKGFCPALGVTSTCAAPVEKVSLGKQGSLGVQKHAMKHSKTHSSSKHRHRRSLTGIAPGDDEKESTPTTSVTISAARFAEAAEIGVTSSGSVAAAPEAPAFECASSRACEPLRAGGAAHTESFLCQPLTFGSCVWSDELCDQRSTRHATRRATTKRSSGDVSYSSGALGHSSPVDSTLTLTPSSVESYLGLRMSNVAGAETRDATQIGVVSSASRTVLAATVAAVTAFVAFGARASRAAVAERKGKGKGEKTKLLLGVEVKAGKVEAKAGKVEVKAGNVAKAATVATVATPEPKAPEKETSQKTTPVPVRTSGAGKPPLFPRTPVRVSSSPAATHQYASVVAIDTTSVVDYRAVELGEAAESDCESAEEVEDEKNDTPRSANTDDEIDAWLAD